ncbi:MAG: SDR family oxidoreductase [Anaerolineales bacterium]|jgi:NAD(P)-dependent dehydrogenase (short-subunit alcohol dehydrogenase family)
MKNVLITGGSRGIGLEFARQYLMKGHHVFAASRHPEKSAELQELKVDFDERLSIYRLDVSKEESRHLLFQQLSKEAERLDILINNAGVASGNEKFRYRFGELNQEDLCRCLSVNSVAQLMMTEKFFSLLEKGKRPIVVNISSNSGSITRKRGGGDTGYGYSASKAALNMITKMLSHELMDSGIIVVSLHPGWVRTTMLYCENAPLEPVESINGMIRVIEALNMDDTGRFLDWKGNELPW